MQFLSNLWSQMHSPVGVAIIGSLLMLSEALGMSEKFKESSILGYIIKALKALKEKVSPKA